MDLPHSPTWVNLQDGIFVLPKVDADPYGTVGVWPDGTTVYWLDTLGGIHISTYDRSLDTAPATGVGWKVPMARVPHGQVSDSTTQGIADTTVAYPITYDTNEDVTEGLTHSVSVNPSRIYVDLKGSYEIIYSAIADLNTGSNKEIDIWLRVNGTDVDRTNTTVNLGGTPHVVITVSFIHAFAAGDYFELVMRGETTAVELIATAAGVSPTRPATPSIIVTAKWVSA